MLNATGDAVFEFGVSHRNSAFWSPQGRFLCLAVSIVCCVAMMTMTSSSCLVLYELCRQGFGNMSGGMDFWDRTTLKLIGSTRVCAAVSHCMIRNYDTTLRCIVVVCVFVDGLCDYKWLVP